MERPGDALREEAVQQTVGDIAVHGLSRIGPEIAVPVMDAALLPNTIRAAGAHLFFIHR